MNAVTHILTQRDAMLAGRNDEVVATARRVHDEPCRKCRYEANRGYFDTLLRLYVKKKMIERRTGDPLGSCDDPRPPQRSWHVRARLEELWPCDRCMARYNPTGRKMK